MVSLSTPKSLEPVSPHSKSTPQRWLEAMHSSENTPHLGRCSIIVMLFNFQISSMSSSSPTQRGHDRFPEKPTESTPPEEDSRHPHNTSRSPAFLPVSSSSEASRLVVLRGSTARDLSTLYKHACEGLGSIRSLTFYGKAALCYRYGGAGSIGAAAILQGSIDGGSCGDGLPRAIFAPEVSQCYQSLYASRGARGSQMVLVSFNQGSKQDVEELCRLYL